MKFIFKIVNWFGSGFFRKLGSFFAWFILGLLMFALMNKFDFDFNIFGVVKVNASTITYSSSQYLTQWCTDRTCDYTLSGSSYYVDYQNINVNTTNNNYNYLTAIRFQTTFNSSNYLQGGQMYTFRYKVNLNPKYNFNYYYNNDWDYYFSVTDLNDNSTDITNVSCSVTNITNDNYGFYITCLYTPVVTVKKFFMKIEFPYEVYVDDNGFHAYPFRTMSGINYKELSITYSDNSIDSINNQTQIIHEQTTEIINQQKETNEILNNTDVTESVDESIDFVNNFSSSSENAISSLITLPFTFLQSLVLNQNRDICFTLKNKTICLPNGQKTIWSKDFGQGCHDRDFFGCVNNSKRDEFKSIFNLIVGGFLSYKLIVDLIHKIHEWLSPDKDVIEVMKL